MIRTALVTTFGLGMLRPASGTWGSMPTALIAWLLLLYDSGVRVYIAALVAILVVFSVACLLWGKWAEERFGKKDPGQVVADETAGQCVTLLPIVWFAPELMGGSFWSVSIAVGIGFVLFRIMDIIKPPPANGLQRLRGGVGVLVDDLFAGAYAAVPLWAYLWFLAPMLGL